MDSTNSKDERRWLTVVFRRQFLGTSYCFGNICRAIIFSRRADTFGITVTNHIANVYAFFKTPFLTMILKIIYARFKILLLQSNVNILSNMTSQRLQKPRLESLPNATVRNCFFIMVQAKIHQQRKKLFEKVTEGFCF